MSLLGSIFAGGVAGGSKAYTNLQEEKRQAMREQQKEAMLLKRMEHLQKLSQDFQKSMAEDTRAHQDKVRGEEKADETRKENIENADARMTAMALYGEEVAPGILGSTGGDDYSVPITEDDIKRSMSGQGLLALEEKQYARAKDEKKEAREGQKFDLEMRELNAKIKQLQEDKIEKITLYGPNGESVSTKDPDRVRSLISKGWTDIKPGKDISASEKTRMREESDSIISGADIGYDPETRTALVDKSEADRALSVLRQNGYPNAKIQKTETDEKLIGDDVTTVTISAGRFDHTAIGNATQETKPMPEEIKPFFSAIQSGDFDKLDKMQPDEFNKYAENLAQYLGVTKGEVLREIDRLAREAGYSPGEKDSGYGLRNDGTPKGVGFLGEVSMPNGQIATELSIGVQIDGKEVEIPLLIPGLSQNEIDTIIASKKPSDIPKSIVDKAVRHAKERIKNGLSPFYQKGGTGGQALPDSEQKNKSRGIVAPQPKQDRLDPLKDTYGAARDALRPVGKGIDDWIKRIQR